MPFTELFTPRLDCQADPHRALRFETERALATAATVRSAPEGTILVPGGTGTTERRVVERLKARGLPVRAGSSAAPPLFDWHDQATWGPALCGIDRIYLTYFPDRAAPGAAEKICLFTALAVALGVRRLVLLSGAGGTEEARCAEEAVRGASVEWTILRSSRFHQDLGVGSLRSAVLDGEMRGPFADADDIADVVVAVLTEDGHAGRLYELTGRGR